MYCTLEFQIVYHAMKHPFYIVHMYAYLHTPLFYEPSIQFPSTVLVSSRFELEGARGPDGKQCGLPRVQSWFRD